MVGAFSMLRRYKNRQLWSNSMLHHFQENLTLYFADRTYSRRLLCLFTAFIAAQAIGIA